MKNFSDSKVLNEVGHGGLERDIYFTQNKTPIQ
jgi:hypothetical protein